MKIKENEDIKNAMKEAGLYTWQLAERLGVSEMTIYRWLRTPLSDEKRQELLTAISQVKMGPSSLTDVNQNLGLVDIVAAIVMIQAKCNDFSAYLHQFHFEINEMPEFCEIEQQIENAISRVLNKPINDELLIKLNGIRGVIEAWEFAKRVCEKEVTADD